MDGLTPNAKNPKGPIPKQGRHIRSKFKWVCRLGLSLVLTGRTRISHRTLTKRVAEELGKVNPALAILVRTKVNIRGVVTGSRGGQEHTGACDRGNVTDR